jgi:hypothetical protein
MQLSSSRIRAIPSGAFLMVISRSFRSTGLVTKSNLRIASLPEVKAQLRDWIEDFEAEAEAIERGQSSFRVREHAER